MHTTVTTGEITTSTTNMAHQNPTHRPHRPNMPHRKRKHTIRGLISLAGASQIRSAKDFRSWGEGMLLQKLSSVSGPSY